MEKIPTIEKLFYYTAIFIDLLPIILFIVFLKKCKQNGGLVFLVIGTLISFILNYATSVNTGSSQILLGHAFALLEFIFFITFLWLNITNRKAKFFLIASSLFFIFFFIIDLQKKNLTFNSLTVGVEAIIILSFSFYFLYQLINSLKTTFIYSDFRFWIILGMLLYLSGSFFIYIYAEQQKIYAASFWYLTYVFYIFKSLFLSIAILVYIYQFNENKTTNKNIPYLDLI